MRRITTASIGRLLSVAAVGHQSHRGRAQQHLKRALALDGHNRAGCAILCARLIAERRQQIRAGQTAGAAGREHSQQAPASATGRHQGTPATNRAGELTGQDASA